MLGIHSAIILSHEEEQLFDVVLESLKWKGKATIARVAGGWVRDKLLGKECDDIDIALDDQLGFEFAQGVNEFLCSRGFDVGTVGVIQVVEIL